MKNSKDRKQLSVHDKEYYFSFGKNIFGKQKIEREKKKKRQFEGHIVKSLHGHREDFVLNRSTDSF